MIDIATHFAHSNYYNYFFNKIEKIFIIINKKKLLFTFYIFCFNFLIFLIEEMKVKITHQILYLVQPKIIIFFIIY